MECVKRFEDELKLAGYSFRTKKSYLFHLKEYLNYCNNQPDELTKANIKQYLLYLIEEKKISKAFWNQAISAIKFFHTKVLENPWELKGIVRPRGDKKLPVILSQEEVARLISCIENSKHRTIMMLIYSAGLRVGESVRLRVEDIDSQRPLPKTLFRHPPAGRGNGPALYPGTTGTQGQQNYGDIYPRQQKKPWKNNQPPR